MSLDEHAFPTATRRRYGCRVGDILNELDEADRATLLRVLANPKATNVGIAETLTEAGYPVGQTTIRQHRLPSHRCPD